jgi:hypothetical protein
MFHRRSVAVIATGLAGSLLAPLAASAQSAPTLPPIIGESSGVVPAQPANPTATTLPYITPVPITPVLTPETVIGGVATVEATAEASPHSTAGSLAELKAKGAKDIAVRQKTLADSLAKLASQPKDCGFNATMAAEIQRTAASLANVGQALATTADLNAAKTLYRSIFIDHRVYLVVRPKASAVVRCDSQLVRNDKLANEGVQLQQRIDALRAKGIDTTAAQNTKNAALATLSTINPAPAVAAVMGIAPDRGDKNIQAANTAAFKAADAALDNTANLQRQVDKQLDQVRRSINENNRSADQAAREAERNARKAERDAKKAQREAEKAKERAEKEARKALRNEARNDRKGKS